MRISLTQTILLSTALLTMNFPLSAMEATADNSDVDTLKLASTGDVVPDASALKTAASDIVPVNSPYLEKAKELSTTFFGKEVYESFDVFQKIAELLDDKDSAFTESIIPSSVEIDSDVTTSISALSTNGVVAESLQTKKEPSVTPSEQLTLDSQRFTSGKLTLIAEHFNRPHPDFNPICTELADNFLETILPDGIQGKASGTTETIRRLTKIHDYFKSLVDATNTKIERYDSTKSSTDTEATRILAEQLIQQHQTEKAELKERFQNLLIHFSETRKFITQANTTITSKRKIIDNASAPDLAFKNTSDITSAAVEKLEKDILYLKKLIIEVETFLHALYDFDRTDLHLAQTPNPLGKMVVLLKSALSSSAGIVTNALNESRTLRYDMTGISVLPRSIAVSATFNSLKCGGSEDQTLHERYITYIQAMLDPTPALFDALLGGRIKFAEPQARAEKTSSGLQIEDSKSAGGGNDQQGDKKKMPPHLFLLQLT